MLSCVSTSSSHIRYSLVVELESQLDALLIRQVELVLNRQLRIVGVYDCVLALLQVWSLQPKLCYGGNN